MQPSNPDQNPLIDISLRYVEVAVYIKELEDKNWTVRFYAARALAKSEDPQAIEALHAALKNNSRNVRFTAVYALAGIGDLHAVEPLIIAYKEWWRWLDRNSTAGLLFHIAGYELPRRILSSMEFTPAQKLDFLEGLIGIVYRDRIPEEKELFYVHSYGIDSVQAFCEEICRQIDSEESVKQGAEEVLQELRNRPDAKTLLRASVAELAQERKELLRGASGQLGAAPSEEQLRPSENVAEQTSHGKLGFLSRLFRRK
jgi:hypothetical protein